MRLRDIPPAKLGLALAIPAGVLIVLSVIGVATSEGGMKGVRLGAVYAKWAAEPAFTVTVELPPAKPPVQVVER